MKSLYSDKEIGKLIERAYQLQQKDEANQGYGLSIEELHKLAEEMGIQPQYLEKALHENETLITKPEKQKRPVWGVPLDVEEEMVIKGEVSDDAWEEIVQRLREIYKNHGTSEHIGKTRSWIFRTGQSQEEVISFSVSTKNGQSKLRLKEQRYNLKASLVIGAMLIPLVMLLMFIMIAKSLSIATIWSLLPTVLLMLPAFFGTRLLLQNFASEPTEGQRFLKKLGRKLETEYAQTTSQKTSTPVQTEVPKPLLNLDSLPDIPESESNTSIRNRDVA